MPWYLRRLMLFAIAEGGGSTATTTTASSGTADTTVNAGTTTADTTTTTTGLLDRATKTTTTADTTTTTGLTTALDATILTTNKDLKALFDQELGKRAPTVKDGKLGDIAVPQKFMNADGTLNVANLLKSQTALETKLPKAATFTPPATPADYKFTPSDANKGKVDAIDVNEPTTKRYLEIMHKHGIPQEAFNELANATYEMAAAENGGTLDPKAVADAEFAKLGPNAQAIVDGLSGWLGALKDQGTFSESELKEAHIMAGTYDGAIVMMKLRELAGEQPIDLRGTVSDGLPSADDFVKMMGETVDGKPGSETKYVADSTYRAKMDDIANKLYGNQPAGTSRAGLGGVQVTGLQPARLMPAAPGRR